MEELVREQEREVGKPLESTTEKYKVIIKDINGWFGNKQALRNVSLNIKEKTVAAFIGPSGCGKTTLIRCLNRMHEMTPGARVEGQVRVDGEDIYDKSVDPVVVKRRVGMVFQKPNPFPTMSIFYNVADGLKLNGIKYKKLITEVVEEDLK